MKKKKNNNNRIVTIILFLAYILIISLACFDFYNLKTGDEIGFTLLYFYFLIPIITLMVSIYIGKNNLPNIVKILLIILFSFLYMSPLLGTFIKGEDTLFGLFEDHYQMIFNGLIISLVGLIIGLIINGHKLKKKK